MKINLKSLAVLVIAVLPLIAAIEKGEPPGPHEDFGGKAEIQIKDIPYVPSKPNNEKLMLDVYSNPHEGLWPVVVMIHGGSWMRGDKSMSPKVYVCKVLAANGYVAFNINYRLLPKTPIKKQVEDAMAAVIWVKEHAEEYGGDPDRIAVAGGSAGGHIASLVAWASDDPFFEPTGYEGTLDSDVLAAALYYPVIDFDETLVDNGGKALRPLARMVFTGKVDGPYKKLMEHLSPKNHIDEECVPTLFLTGDADSLKLYPQSVEYVEKLNELGVHAELYTAPGKDHGFPWNYWEPESVESAERIVEFFDTYLK